MRTDKKKRVFVLQAALFAGDASGEVFSGLLKELQGNRRTFGG